MWEPYIVINMNTPYIKTIFKINVFLKGKTCRVERDGRERERLREKEKEREGWGGGGELWYVSTKPGQISNFAFCMYISKKNKNDVPLRLKRIKMLKCFVMIRNFDIDEHVLYMYVLFPRVDFSSQIISGKALSI